MKLPPDPRRFLGWDAPALPAVAGILMDEHTHGDTVDMSNTAVVLPGGRAGRRLKELLAAEAERRRVRLVPPLVTTVGTLPELLCTPASPVAAEQLCRRIWLRQLQALDATERIRLFPHVPAPDDLCAWLDLAGEVVRLHREVAAAGRRFDDVATMCADMPLHDDRGRWEVLARLQRGYAAELARLGFVDRDLARIEALGRGAASCERDLWLVCVPELPNIVRALVQRLPLSASLRVLVHAPADRQGAFDALGCVRPEAWLDAEIPLTDAQLAVVGHPSNQAAAAAQVLAALGGEFAADEVVIGVPDGEVVSYLERRLATAGVPARYAGGDPLARTSAFRLLEALADVLRDRSFDSVAALARHPAFGAWLRRRRWQVPHAGAAAFRESDGWLVQLDTYRAERLPVSIDDPPAGEEDWVRSVVEALRAALLDDTLLGAFRGTRRLGDWAPRVLELVLEIYGDGARSRDVPEERRLLGLAQALRNAAAAHAGMPPELDPECDVATAIRVLLDDIRGETLPPAADEAAIELLGWLELHLDDAPVAVLTGMNEGRVPESVNADAFLPNALRARLGCEDNDRRHARDAYQLTAMLHARRVYAIAGRRSLRGDPLRPSRLLLATSGDALARRVRTFLVGDDACARPAAEATSPGDVSGFRLPPEPVLSLPDVPERLSVTEFRQLLSDPYAWALARAIGDSIVDGASELDPLTFGGLAHEVLEAFGRSGVRDSLDPVAIGDQLEAALDARVAITYGHALPAVRLQVEQLRMRLRAFACAQASWAQDGWRIVGTECRAPEGVPLDVDGMPIRVHGRIDRIDYHAARDEWAVFDYKTGEHGDGPDAVHRNKDEWQDLQLPLYRFMLPHVEYDRRRVFTGGHDAHVRLGYILLCGDPTQVRFELAEWSTVELDGAMEAAKEAVRTVRGNRFVFPGMDNRRYDDDTAALLGRGRLVLEEDEELEQEVGA